MLVFPEEDSFRDSLALFVAFLAQSAALWTSLFAAILSHL